MRKISEPVKRELKDSKYHGKCLRALLLEDHECQGRITWEHALTYAGRQMDEYFAIIFLCAYSHSVDEFQDCGILDKQINHWIAINRMTEDDFER